MEDLAFKQFRNLDGAFIPVQASQFIDGKGNVVGAGEGSALLSSITSVPGGNTVTGTTTETTLASTIRIDHNSLVAGTVLRLTATGIYKTNAVNLTLRVKLGGQTLITGSILNFNDTYTDGNNRGFYLEGIFTINSISVTGSVEGSLLIISTNDTNDNSEPSQSYAFSTESPVVVNTSIDQILSVTAQWADTTDAPSITFRQLILETVNKPYFTSEQPVVNTGGGLPVGVRYATASLTVPDYDSLYALIPDPGQDFNVPINKSWYMDITQFGKRLDTGELGIVKIYARIKNVNNTVTITSQTDLSETIGGSVIQHANNLLSVSGTSILVRAQASTNTPTQVTACCTIYEL